MTCHSCRGWSRGRTNRRNRRQAASITPDGIPLNATYIEYLRRILPRGQVRLRMSGDMHPVVIVADARVLGVLMPVKK